MAKYSLEDCIHETIKSVYEYIDLVGFEYGVKLKTIQNLNYDFQEECQAIIEERDAIKEPLLQFVRLLQDMAADARREGSVSNGRND